ncbi:MAG: OmpA family protein [Flavobacteriales bacterium AspAUS03]
MEKNLINILALGIFLFGNCIFGQEKEIEENHQDGKYYGREKKYVNFTINKVKFNSWSIGLYGGVPVLHSGDLRSFTKDNKSWGYDVQLPITKQITHAFGLQLLGQYGQTKQFSRPNEGGLMKRAYWIGKTNYWGMSLLTDVNFTSLLRGVDNKSQYRWALHGYAGPGVLYYITKLNSSDGSKLEGMQSSYNDKIMFSSGLGSIFFQGGLGLKYKISRRFDAELRGMWIYTGDEAFDGSGFGSRGDERLSVADIKPGRYDSFFTTSLGFTYTIGGHPESLFWYDPLQALYPPQKVPKVDFKVCKKGDNDNDGVCDDWDVELNTPTSARVDGSGKALDVDLDGVIDLYDKCVTVHGLSSNQGCPLQEKKSIKKEFDTVGKERLNNINKEFKGIQFDLNNAAIKPKYHSTLKEAAALMIEYPHTNFVIIGHTDASGSAPYNFKLSKKRGESVKKFLVSEGVKASRLTVVAKRKTKLKYPECDDKHYKIKNCTAKNSETGLSKNDENRRVEFIQKFLRD